MSGTGMLTASGRTSGRCDSCLGIWSSVDAEKMLRVPERLQRAAAQYSSRPILCAAGLPSDMRDGVAAVRCDERRQAALDLGEGLVPARLDEARRRA